MSPLKFGIFIKFRKFLLLKQFEFEKGRTICASVGSVSAVLMLVAWVACLRGWRVQRACVSITLVCEVYYRGLRASVGTVDDVLTQLRVWRANEGGMLLLLLLLLLKYYPEEKNVGCLFLKQK